MTETVPTPAAPENRLSAGKTTRSTTRGDVPAAVLWIQAQQLGLEVQGHRPRERDRQAAGLEPRPPLPAELADRMARAAVVVRHLIPDAALQTRLIAEALDRFQVRHRERDPDRNQGRDRGRSR